METRRLGNSDLDITRIGFGAWAIGGSDTGWAWAWGKQEDEASMASIRHAIERGMNWIDTAAIYGLGHSEEVVGRTVGAMSQKPYIFTKSSQRWHEGTSDTYESLRYDSIIEECELSLRRLNVEVIDLYQIHWPHPEHEIEDGWRAMAELQRQGKVRWIGVSNFSVEQMRRAQAIAPITSLQPPYSLLRRDVETDILPFCLEHNIGVINYSPMQTGLLSGKMTRERAENLPDDDWRSRDDNFREPRLSRNLAVQDKLAEIGARHGRTAGEVAIAWTLTHPAVTGAIVGARSPEQVDGIIGAGDFSLAADELTEIDQFVGANA